MYWRYGDESIFGTTRGVAINEDTINHLQLELHVPDHSATLDFYSQLGFKKVWHRSEGNTGDYLVMEKDGTILNFWPGNDTVWEQSYFKRFRLFRLIGITTQLWSVIFDKEDSEAVRVGGLKI